MYKFRKGNLAALNTPEPLPTPEKMPPPTPESPPGVDAPDGTVDDLPHLALCRCVECLNLRTRQRLDGSIAEVACLAGIGEVRAVRLGEPVAAVTAWHYCLGFVARPGGPKGGAA